MDDNFLKKFFFSVSGIDGLIDLNEYTELFRKIFPHLDYQTVRFQAAQSFALVDRNRNGRISYNEYLETLRRSQYANYNSSSGFPNQRSYSPIPFNPSTHRSYSPIPFNPSTHRSYSPIQFNHPIPNHSPIPNINPINNLTNIKIHRLSPYPFNPQGNYNNVDAYPYINNSHLIPTHHSTNLTPPNISSVSFNSNEHSHNSYSSSFSNSYSHHMSSHHRNQNFH